MKTLVFSPFIKLCLALHLLALLLLCWQPAWWPGLLALLVVCTG
jgi:hypothetical protein